MKKVMVIYGTRPEAIKVAPLILALREDPDFEPIAVSTGQHKEMLEQVHKVFNFRPDYDLAVFEQGQSLNKLAGKVFLALDKLFAEVHPDLVLVQGDTTTVSVAAQAAFYAQIPVAHLEAGLRSGDIHSPFPEEANRRIATQVSELHLAPSQSSVDNLLREGIDPEKIALTGNTVIDALIMASKLELKYQDPHLERIMNSEVPMVLVTCHRRENWHKLEQIGLALRELAETYPAMQFLFPVHGNPMLRQALVPHIEHCENVYVCEPLPYEFFAAALKKAHIVLSDSGGVQEEAPALKTPVLCMRNSTERPSAVQAGGVKLVGTDKDFIVSSFRELIDDPAVYLSMTTGANPYGDGTAAIKSIEAIKSLLEIG
ncbi:UDP-N-acetylglucosamine 2-epimerase [Boudabousia liubingyangii]|uniref:non-hydrolyzing UDP-N-acetylglucosamine 2-epimerase n=1 Tax=Boudabousia liubingyangii TaxID=1921764 RepID=UPI00093B1CA3|nr:UDP-N-acetylglucosamine 2-epimerase (non-hydrolyzing) [Boudabousia liubingyangii]OKL48481.1 UDP-N-acetylglucosamine 2-epimerase [Boudabousia liubingyangii]